MKDETQTTINQHGLKLNPKINGVTPCVASEPTEKEFICPNCENGKNLIRGLECFDCENTKVKYFKKKELKGGLKNE